MNKVLAGLIVAVAALLSVGLSSPALAYPDTPPASELTPPKVTSAAPDSAEAAPARSNATTLPSTGGPSVLLLVGGAVLVLAGAGVLVVNRRRQTA